MDDIENYIKDFENPFFCYCILLDTKIITETNSNMICNLFIKYHWNEFIKYPMDIINDYFKINNNINKFYFLVNKINNIKKNIINMNIKKLKNKSMSEITIFINNSAAIFMSMFKYISLFNTYSIAHEKIIKEHLITTYKLFGYNFINKFNIVILSNSFYELLNYKEKYNYYHTFMNKIYNVINIFIKYIKLYKTYYECIMEFVN